MQQKDQDILNYQNDKFLLSKLDKIEKIVLSIELDKFNDFNKIQRRVLVITTQRLINICEDTIDKIFNLIKITKPKIRRLISFDEISSISVSKSSDQFIIHVKNSYDYRYQSNQKQNILTVLLEQYKQCVNQPLQFNFLLEQDLQDYKTDQVDIKMQIRREPFGSIKIDNVELLQTYLVNNFINKMKQKKTDFSSDSVRKQDFIQLRLLGKGAYGKVTLVKKKYCDELYALKSIQKRIIIEQNMINLLKTERQLMINNCPFLVNLKYCFQSNDKIYMVMPFIRGGDLMKMIEKKKNIDEKVARFYAAEIILALEYLHKNGVVYRDLKPANLLLDEQGHLKLADMGLSIRNKKTSEKKEFYGTLTYIAPETVQQICQDTQGDWWALGIVIYEMLYGKRPFSQEKSQQELFKQIEHQEVYFSQKIYISIEAQDIINKLLIKDMNKRIGCSQKGIQEIKDHPWFKDYDWNQISQKKMQPPYIPSLKEDPLDNENFYTDQFNLSNTQKRRLYQLISQIKMMHQRFIQINQSYDSIKFI